MSNQPLDPTEFDDLPEDWEDDDDLWGDRDFDFDDDDDRYDFETDDENFD
jgi:hypothetical protein